MRASVRRFASSRFLHPTQAGRCDGARRRQGARGSLRCARASPLTPPLPFFVSSQAPVTGHGDGGQSRGVVRAQGAQRLSHGPLDGPEATQLSLWGGWERRGGRRPTLQAPFHPCHVANAGRVQGGAAPLACQERSD